MPSGVTPVGGTTPIVPGPSCEHSAMAIALHRRYTGAAGSRLGVHAAGTSQPSTSASGREEPTPARERLVETLIGLPTSPGRLCFPGDGKRTYAARWR